MSKETKTAEDGDVDIFNLRSAVMQRSTSALPQRVEEELEPRELLGETAFGMVHMTQEKATGQSRILKTVYRPENWDAARLKREAEILKGLDHPHILRIFRMYDDEESVNIVMDHCEGGGIMETVKEGRTRNEFMPEPWVSVALRQSLEALIYIHSKGIAHKDLKSQDILLLYSTASSDGRIFQNMPHVVLTGLGIAEISCRGTVGVADAGPVSSATMAPEIWKGTKPGSKADIWGMGVLMFEIFTGSLPFVSLKGDMKLAWLTQLKDGPDWKLMKCSADAKKLCAELLAFEPDQRPMANIAIKHSWFRVCGELVMLPTKEAKILSLTLCRWPDRNAAQRAFCLKMAAGATCVNKFARVFSMFDADSSGVLDSQEVISALMSLGIDEKSAKLIAVALDINKDNSTDYCEFCAACLSSLKDEYNELLRQEFRKLDRRKQGALTEEDLAPLLSELQALAKERKLELQDLDLNGDCRVSFGEFCAYFGSPGMKMRDTSDTIEIAGRQRRSSRSGLGLALADLPMKQHIRIVNGERRHSDGAVGVGAGGYPGGGVTKWGRTTSVGGQSQVVSL